MKWKEWIKLKRRTKLPRSSHFRSKTTCGSLWMLSLRTRPSTRKPKRTLHSSHQHSAVNANCRRSLSRKVSWVPFPHVYVWSSPSLFCSQWPKPVSSTMSWIGPGLNRTKYSRKQMVPNDLGAPMRCRHVHSLTYNIQDFWYCEAWRCKQCWRPKLQELHSHSDGRRFCQSSRRFWSCSCRTWWVWRFPSQR